MLCIEEIIENSRKLNIDEVTEYILAIPKFAEKIGTEDLKVLMKHLGDPQKKAKAVHIAGTNGKGSTTEMIRLMLTEAGFTAGSFTSPHLVKINERIAINGAMISDEDFNSCFRTVINAVYANGLRHPSFFEFIFAMAAVYFAEKQVDYVVYETGMGGRLDATNIITPVVSVITSIGMDHMQYLGDTVEKIAFEKAGIIKQGVPVVHNAICHEAARIGGIVSVSDYDMKKRAVEVIAGRAAELGAELFITDRIDSRLLRWLGEDAAKTDTTRADITATTNVDITATQTAVKTDAEAALTNPVFLTQYQLENASTAIKAFEIIYRQSKNINRSENINQSKNINQSEDIRLSADTVDDIILRALNKFIMPARMEMIRKNVIIDGAHNTDAMPQFLSAAREMVKREKPEKVYFIFAVSSDKDYRGMVKMICDADIFDEIYITTFNSSRKTDVEVISDIFKDYDVDIHAIPEVRSCLDEVLMKLRGRDILFTAGSLYLAGEIEAILGRK